jgi:tetratricopeptide (TPR) repeat protein
MKRETGQLLMMPLLLLLLASCAAQFPFLASATLSEATELKVLCGQQKLEAAEIKIADSLYQQGSILAKKGKNEPAYSLLDRAIACYRIALTKSAIAKKEKEIARQEQALAKTREDVSAYQQVLQELKTMEQQ